ncbi:MAG: dephospho-CoA kinase [Chloroflexota bacterium]|nr:dephospho-CoA kinase [Chloroflexota bacterium]
MTRPFVIGVTGRIACGKSTVLREMAALGAVTFDADAVYHDLIAPNAPLWRALRDRFGAGVVGADGRIDRRTLGGIVFNDPNALADLDRLTHPAVTEELRRRVAATPAKVVAVDAVKLVESGIDRDCDRVWVVVCPKEEQIERLMARNGVTRDEAERRVAAQPSAERMMARADLVIDNGGGLQGTRQQVRDAWQRLMPTVVSGTGRANENSVGQNRPSTEERDP